MPDPIANRPVRLPGASRRAEPNGMDQYIVNLIEVAPKSNVLNNRRALFEQNVSRSREFQSQLVRELEKMGLSDQVAGVGEPMGFPVVTLTCTPEVAKVIEAMPDVDSVYADKF